MCKGVDAEALATATCCHQASPRTTPTPCRVGRLAPRRRLTGCCSALWATARCCRWRSSSSPALVPSSRVSGEHARMPTEGGGRQGNKWRPHFLPPYLPPSNCCGCVRVAHSCRLRAARGAWPDAPGARGVGAAPAELPRQHRLTARSSAGACPPPRRSPDPPGQGAAAAGAPRWPACVFEISKHHGLTPVLGCPPPQLVCVQDELQLLLAKVALYRAECEETCGQLDAAVSISPFGCLEPAHMLRGARALSSVRGKGVCGGVAGGGAKRAVPRRGGGERRVQLSPPALTPADLPARCLVWQLRGLLEAREDCRATAAGCGKGGAAAAAAKGEGGPQLPQAACPPMPLPGEQGGAHSDDEAAVNRARDAILRLRGLDVLGTPDQVRWRSGPRPRAVSGEQGLALALAVGEAGAAVGAAHCMQATCGRVGGKGVAQRPLQQHRAPLCAHPGLAACCGQGQQGRDAGGRCRCSVVPDPAHCATHAGP